MSKVKKSRFGANVVDDAKRRKREGSAFGYLNLPDGVHMLKDLDAIDSKKRILMDIIPYIVKMENHPDANPDNPDSALPGNPWYKLPIMVHRNVGVDNESIICPRTIGQKCPICEERETQLNSGMDWKEALSKPQQRILYVVIPIGAKNHEEEYHIYDKAHSLFQKYIDADLEEDPELGRFPDVFEGLTLKIRFSEEAFNKNEYLECSRIDYEERDEGIYDEGIMEDAPCLDDLINVLSYKQIYAKFFEMEAEDVDDGEQEEKAPVRSTRTERKRKQVEPEEETEQPRRSSRTSRRTRPEPEEEKPAARATRRRRAEPEMEEEPEEKEEAPARGTRRGRRSTEPVTKSKHENKCPFGHVFGEDWDAHADCDDCNQEHPGTFDECGEEKEKLNK